MLIDDPTRFEGVAVIGVGEHVWRHTRRGDRYVTVIIDLTPVREGVGPSRLLDMVEGRSKAVFKTSLAERPCTWRDRVEVVAMDGFTGFTTAAAEKLPDAVAVMEPFHVVRLAGEAVDLCRRRIQLQLRGHRGRSGDPLYSCRRTVHTGAGLYAAWSHPGCIRSQAAVASLAGVNPIPASSGNTASTAAATADSTAHFTWPWLPACAWP